MQRGRTIGRYKAMNVNSTQIKIDLFSMGVNISLMVFLVHIENKKT
jgi:hypothetical protein